MRFLHTADLHILARPDRDTPFGPEREEALKQLPAELADICNRENVDLLLIAGDLFHYPPRRQELETVAAAFSALSHTRVVMISGERDFLRPGSAYSEFDFGERITLLSDARPSSVFFPQWNLEVHGFSYTGPVRTEPLPEDLVPPQDGRRHILMLHGGDEEHLPLDHEELLAAGWTYVALGHLHKPGISTGGRLAYPGSPDAVTPQETGSHGYYLGTLTPEALSITWKPFGEPAYRSAAVTVTPQTTDEELAERIRRLTDESPRCLWDISLTGRRDPGHTIALSADSLPGRIRRITDDTLPAYDWEALRDLPDEKKAAEAALTALIPAVSEEEPGLRSKLREELDLLAGLDLTLLGRGVEPLRARHDEELERLRPLEAERDALAAGLARRETLMQESAIPPQATVKADRERLSSLKDQLALYEAQYKESRIPRAVREVLVWVLFFASLATVIPVIGIMQDQKWWPNLLFVVLGIVCITLYSRLSRINDAERANDKNRALLAEYLRVYVPDKAGEPCAAEAEKLDGYLARLEEFHGYLGKIQDEVRQKTEELEQLRTESGPLETELNEKERELRLKEGFEMQVRRRMEKLDALDEAEAERQRLAERRRLIEEELAKAEEVPAADSRTAVREDHL